MGKVRIIGGQWRGRKLEFPDKMNLRPTHDRLRETLFNWLMHDIAGACCLDLFSGSGALGFEAISRGAEKVFFIDNDSDAITALKKNAEKLDKNKAEIIYADFQKSPPKFPEKIFDIVFLDPPFESDLIFPSLNWLLNNHLLKPRALIYAERKKSETPFAFQQDFEIIKKGATQTIEYFLLRFLSPTS